MPPSDSQPPPVRAIPPLMPHSIICSQREDVQAIRSPRNRIWWRDEDTAQRLPTAPIRAIPPFVPDGAIRPQRKDVQPIWSPRDGIGWRDQDAAQRLPTAPIAPSHHLCQTALSVPSAKMSNRSGPHERPSAARRGCRPRPAAPIRAIPPLVPDRAIRPQREDVQPIRSPRDRRRRRDQDATQRLPAAPSRYWLDQTGIRLIRPSDWMVKSHPTAEYRRCKCRRSSFPVLSSNQALSAGSVMASQSSWLLTFVSESMT